MSRRIDTFLKIASEDLAHARDNLASHPKHAAHSLQQAAEKMLKGMLDAHAIRYPVRSHQLDELLTLLPKDNPYRDDFRDLLGLTAAATVYRYPTPAGAVPKGPDVEVLRAQLERLFALVADIANYLRELK